MIVDLNKNKIGMHIVCMAIGKDHHLVDEMESIENDEPGTRKILKDVKLIVGGVELNFENVVERIDEAYNEALNRRARKMIEEKFDNLDDTLEFIKEKLMSEFMEEDDYEK